MVGSSPAARARSRALEVSHRVTSSARTSSRNSACPMPPVRASESRSGRVSRHRPSFRRRLQRRRCESRGARLASQLHVGRGNRLSRVSYQPQHRPRDAPCLRHLRLRRVQDASPRSGGEPARWDRRRSRRCRTVLRSEEQSRVANAFGALSGIRSVITNDEDRPAWSERTDCPPQHAPALVTRDAENGSG
jgi:hypothetical protein